MANKLNTQHSVELAYTSPFGVTTSQILINNFIINNKRSQQRQLLQTKWSAGIIRITSVSATAKCYFSVRHSESSVE